MTKYTSKLTVNILTFRTEKKILNDCINSIDKSIPINIIENSTNFQHEVSFKKKRKNIKVFCTGNNFGYGKGHNYGFFKTKTRYVLICNPDVIFKKNYFKKVIKYLKKKVKFNIIGSQYIRNKMNRPAYGLFETKKINPYIKKDVNGLQKVNWVVGCTMLFDLNKFLKKKIFDENFFLFYEETDLCRRIMKKNGIIYSSSDLIIDHLGEKSSFAAIPELKVDYVKLRNWHLLWSSFYYEKKHFGYFFSFKKHLFSLVKDAMKIIFYIILFNKEKYLKHLYRFSGLISSMIGKKSNFRIY
mgnify:CR=1 FL=1|tara:strand:- start:1519 stop:2415 length:897 start_codon:yes stop_codon:yes gene_type:complete